MTNIWEEFVFQTGLCQACKRCCVNPQAAFRTTLPSHVAGRNRIIIFLPQNFPFSLWQVVLHRKTTWNFISGWIEITFNSKTLYVNVTTVVYKKSLKKNDNNNKKLVQQGDFRVDCVFMVCVAIKRSHCHLSNRTAHLVSALWLTQALLLFIHSFQRVCVCVCVGVGVGETVSNTIKWVV